MLNTIDCFKRLCALGTVFRSTGNCPRGCWNDEQTSLGVTQTAARRPDVDATAKVGPGTHQPWMGITRRKRCQVLGCGTNFQWRSGRRVAAEKNAIHSEKSKTRKLPIKWSSHRSPSCHPTPKLPLKWVTWTSQCRAGQPSSLPAIVNNIPTNPLESVCGVRRKL